MEMAEYTEDTRPSVFSRALSPWSDRSNNGDTPSMDPPPAGELIKEGLSLREIATFFISITVIGFLIRVNSSGIYRIARTTTDFHELYRSMDGMLIKEC